MTGSGYTGGRQVKLGMSVNRGQGRGMEHETADGVLHAVPGDARRGDAVDTLCGLHYVEATGQPWAPSVDGACPACVEKLPA